MWFKFVLLLTFLSITQCSRVCSYERTLDVLRRSTYEFSVKLLDNVFLETKFENFVFSPLATWVQLTSLAEGANNDTLKQILRVTKHPKLGCYKKKWREMINKMNSDVNSDIQLRSAIIINKLFSVKKKFLKEVGKLNNVDVQLYNFKNIEKTVIGVNSFVESVTGGKITEIVNSDYFAYGDLVSVGMLHYESNWEFGFQKELTQRNNFYNILGVVGQVDMMKKSGLFNVTYIPVIKSRVLELPCSNDRLSLLIFLPKERQHYFNFFYSLRKIELRSIFIKFKMSGPQYLNLELPRFNMTFDYDNIPELIYDLGARKMFHPKADFKGVSNYPIFTSMMTQVADIYITEGVDNRTPDQENSIIADNPFINSNNYSDFIANKPFVYMLVDRELELILFAGVYSTPEYD